MSQSGKNGAIIMRDDCVNQMGIFEPQPANETSTFHMTRLEGGR